MNIIELFATVMTITTPQLAIEDVSQNTPNSYNFYQQKDNEYLKQEVGTKRKKVKIFFNNNNAEIKVINHK